MADRFFQVKVNIYGRDDETWPEKDENVNRDYGPFEGVLADAAETSSSRFRTPAGAANAGRSHPDQGHLNDDGSIELTGLARDCSRAPARRPTSSVPKSSSV